MPSIKPCWVVATVADTDPRAWLAEAQETVDAERVLRDGDPFYEVQGYLPDGTPLMECNRWERVGLGVADAMAAALAAVLDLQALTAGPDAEPGGDDDMWCQGYRDGLEAARTAITAALGGDRG